MTALLIGCCVTPARVMFGIAGICAACIGLTIIARRNLLESP